MKTILSSKPEILFAQGMWSNTTIMVACQYGQAIIAGILLDYVECFLTGDSYSSCSNRENSATVQLDSAQIARYSSANSSPGFSSRHREEEERRKQVQQLLNHRSEKGGVCAPAGLYGYHHHHALYWDSYLHTVPLFAFCRR